MRRCDIQKYQLVRPLLIIGSCQIDRITDLLQSDKIDSLDDLAVLYIQTRDDSLRVHQASPHSAMAWDRDNVSAYIAFPVIAP